ncbi:hypothetical protein DPSP01_014630 [Paraphaeosphaeria sporulosa]
MGLGAIDKRSFAIIGSTGFLGPYLVASLLAKCSCAVIFCINRGLTGEQRTLSDLRRIRKHKLGEGRLNFVTADITKSGSGLTRKTLAAVLANVDEDPTDAMAHGYGKSKWYAEEMLSKACSEGSLRVAIIRAGQIGGPSTAKYGHWPVQGWIYSIIKASRKQGFWPAHVQSLDWIPVDALAEGVAAISHIPQQTECVEVYNMVHTSPVPWSVLFATLRDRFDINLTEIGLPEWLSLMDARALKLYPFLQAAGRGRECDMTFATTNASRFLPRVEPISIDRLEYWLKGWNLVSDHACDKARL